MPVAWSKNMDMAAHVLHISACLRLLWRGRQDRKGKAIFVQCIRHIPWHVKKNCRYGKYEGASVIEGMMIEGMSLRGRKSTGYIRLCIQYICWSLLYGMGSRVLTQSCIIVRCNGPITPFCSDLPACSLTWGKDIRHFDKMSEYEYGLVRLTSVFLAGGCC